MSSHVCVIGLGYVGLPLAVELAKHFDTIGMDISHDRIAELRDGQDRTNELTGEQLAASSLTLTSDLAEIGACDICIVTVPTPIDEAMDPDLTMIRAASKMAAELVKRTHDDGRKPIVIYESTVYPGVTEDVCAGIIEEATGLVWKTDFFLAYSPERINPGDREHTIGKITKVVSGDTPDTLAKVAALYGKVTTGGVFEAASIRAAEAAKVIENAQRDINIAFMNEITQIFAKTGLSIWDVLDAANTKWNFLPFSPGLVGGHCIGIDPYYLAHHARALDHDPKVILAGRGVNSSMAEWVAGELHKQRGGKAGSVLVLGLSFKEDVPDLRNSKVADMIAALTAHGHDVTVHDPLADAAEARHEYGIELKVDALSQQYDLVVLAVPHREYLDMGAARLRKHVGDNGTLADLKGVLRGQADWTL
ncbi:MAG: nucleotide sugar dehydrogenase [Pontixanthobacter sp.]